MNFSQLASKSRFYQRLERRYESYLHLLESGDPQREGMLVTLKALQEQCLDIPSALRILRQLVMHRLIKLDCEQQAPLATVTRAVTDLAELALDVARVFFNQLGKTTNVGFKIGIFSIDNNNLASDS